MRHLQNHLLTEISTSSSLYFGNFRFEKIVLELESHVDERIDSGSYDALKKHLVPFVHQLLSSEEFPERLILTAAAILDNNCFEISMSQRGVGMGGLFLTSLILNHCCVPNTKHFVNFIDAGTDIQRYEMVFRTTGKRELWKLFTKPLSILQFP